MVVCIARGMGLENTEGMGPLGSQSKGKGVKSERQEAEPALLHSFLKQACIELLQYARRCGHGQFIKLENTWSAD